MVSLCHMVQCVVSACSVPVEEQRDELGGEEEWARPAAAAQHWRGHPTARSSLRLLQGGGGALLLRSVPHAATRADTHADALTDVVPTLKHESTFLVGELGHVLHGWNCALCIFTLVVFNNRFQWPLTGTCRMHDTQIMTFLGRSR